MHSILIIGAGSDMAKAIARKFAAHQFTVRLAGRDSEQLDRLKNDLKNRYGIEASAHIFDVTAFLTTDEFLTSLPELPDIVVYAAGAMGEQADALKDWSITHNMIDVNYTGALSVLNWVASRFSERRSGCIVGISSVAGDRGRGSNFIYGSTKAAFTAYLSGLRNALFKKGVNVITVKPGFVYTKMTQHLSLPAKLTVYPDKVAEQIYVAVVKKKSVIYIKPLWRWIMQIIKIIPEPVFKRSNL